MLSMLAHATTHDEICALIDASDVFARRQLQLQE